MLQIFRKPYRSEITDFLADLKAKRPSLEAEQRAGRNLLWDKPIDRQAEAEYAAAKVPQAPYVYQTHGK
jgi:hypothetical protein